MTYRISPLTRFSVLSVGALTIAAATALVGCSKSESPQSAQLTVSQPMAATAAASPAVADVADAQHTVAAFLDAVRRGGDSGGAHSLLTAEACAVLERLGRSVQPLGSPAAKFVVTRSEAVAEHPGSALVHSTWSEPSETGDIGTVQVVWALEWEAQSWKISGLAMELAEGQEPLIIDFEDLTHMANLFRGQEQPGQPAAAVATGPSDNLSQPDGNLGRF